MSQLVQCHQWKVQLYQDVQDLDPAAPTSRTWLKEKRERKKKKN
jgi:hypothetical protein